MLLARASPPGARRPVWHVAGGGPERPIGARRRLLASLAHTLGADAIFVSLICTARKLAALGSDDALVEWRNAAAGSRRHLRPDGYGLYRHAGQLYGFFLGYDRGTMSARDYRAKFAAYDAYRASGRFERDYQGFPTVLVVTSDSSAEQRIARAVRAATVGRGPALPLLLTCEWRLADPRNPYGLLSPVGREPDRLTRRYWPMDSWMTSVSSRARPLSTSASAQRSWDARTGYSWGGGNA